MYPVSLGFDTALDRINLLNANGHHAEALVTSVFTLEKTIRRSLKIAVHSRGFSMKQAERLLGKKGFNELKELWDIFEKDHRPLSQFIGNTHWQHVPGAVTKRNQLVHGARVYNLNECKNDSEQVLLALKILHQRVVNEYGVDPWTRLVGRRKPSLQWIQTLRCKVG